MDNLDIHNRKARLENIKERIVNAKFSRYNKEKLSQFAHYCELQERLSPGRMERMLGIMYKITEILGKDFNKTTKEDIEKLMENILSKNYKNWTIYTYEVVIRKFFKWLGMADIVDWIKIKADKKTKLPEELLTTKEVERMIEACDLVRDKAFISMLYESGCRIGEIASLKIKHITFDNLGMVIIVNGKTGMRRIRLINSTKFLAKWYNQHINNDNPEANLWYGLGDKRSDLLTYTALQKMIKKAVKKAGIKKKVYPHLLRHSRLTELASELPEFQLKQYAGWGMDSRMAAVYIHLNGDDLDKRILEINGIKKKEKKALDNKLCPRCKTINKPNFKMCSSCGLPLDVQTAVKGMKIEEAFLQALAESPKEKAVIFEKMKSLMKKV